MRTQGPSSVMAMVCSKWALGLPSWVAWVQWSASPRTCLVPRLTIGSTAMTRPGSIRKSPLRRSWALTKLGTWGSSCISRPMPWPTKLSTTAQPMIADVGAHFGGHFAPALLVAHQLDRQLQHAAGDVEQMLDLGGDLADRQRDGRIAAPAGQLAAGVDADDVPFVQDARAGNAVHHFVVDRNAGHGGEGDLARHPLNSGIASCSSKELFDRRVDFAGGHAGLDQAAGDLMGLPDQQAGLAKLGDFAG